MKKKDLRKLKMKKSTILQLTPNQLRSLGGGDNTNYSDVGGGGNPCTGQKPPATKTSQV